MNDGVHLILACVGCGVLIALVLSYFNDRRPDLMRRAAEELGFDFLDVDPVLAAGLHAINVTGTIRNVIHGHAHGLEVRIFDLEQLRTSTNLVRMTVVAFREASDWPEFNLRPRSLTDRSDGDVGGRLFAADIGFLRQYRLESDEDEECLVETFCPDVRTWFANHPGLNLRASGTMLVVTRGRLINPSGIKDFLTSSFEVFNVLRTGEVQT